MGSLADLRVRKANFGGDIESEIVAQPPQTRSIPMGRIERCGGAIFEAHRNHQAAAERGGKAQRPYGASFEDFATLRSVCDPPGEWRFRKSDLPAERLLDPVFFDEPSLVEIPPGHR